MHRISAGPGSLTTPGSGTLDSVCKRLSPSLLARYKRFGILGLTPRLVEDFPAGLALPHYRSWSLPLVSHNRRSRLAPARRRGLGGRGLVGRGLVGLLLEARVFRRC